MTVKQRLYLYVYMRPKNDKTSTPYYYVYEESREAADEEYVAATGEDAQKNFVERRKW